MSASASTKVSGSGLNIKDVLSGKASATVNKNTKAYDDQLEIADDWGDEWAEESAEKDLQKFDYKNTNLNKLSDKELAKHKANMEKGFSSNQLKPGDKGFVYDKRIDFGKKDD